MAYEEYIDLYHKAQNNKNANFKMYLFDVVNSKKMPSYDRIKQHKAMLATMDIMTSALLQLEKTTGQPIMLQDNNVTIKKKQLSKLDKSSIIVHNNPCAVHGDSYCFYVYNNSISELAFLNVFKQSCIITHNHYAYHFKSSNFETTKIAEASDKYYLGHCIDNLSLNKSLPSKTIKVEQKTIESTL